jgi:hypothetical protein
VNRTKVPFSCIASQPRSSASFMLPAYSAGLPLSLKTAHRSACVVVHRLPPLIGHLKADLAQLGTHLEHDPLDAAPDRKIATRRTPRRQARLGGQRDTGNAVDEHIDIRRRTR